MDLIKVAMGHLDATVVVDVIDLHLVTIKEAMVPQTNTVKTMLQPIIIGRITNVIITKTVGATRIAAKTFRITLIAIL